MKEWTGLSGKQLLSVAVISYAVLHISRAMTSPSDPFGTKKEG